MADLDEILKSIYGDEDLATHPFFTGEFINFGYWSGIDINSPISLTSRTKASRALYLYLLDALQVNSSDDVCEMGCGHGHGISLAVKERGVKFAWGIDLQANQIKRASELLKKDAVDSSRWSLTQGSAENTGLKNESVSKIFSVEAAHHFPSIQRFVKECHRILRVGGSFGFITLFPTSDSALKKLPKEVPDLDLVMHPMIPIDEIEKITADNGFTVVQLDSIGKEVFPGFQKWVDQTEKEESWGSIWLEAYERGLIDYYVFIARKNNS